MSKARGGGLIQQVQLFPFLALQMEQIALLGMHPLTVISQRKLDVTSLYVLLVSFSHAL